MSRDDEGIEDFDIQLGSKQCRSDDLSDCPSVRIGQEALAEMMRVAGNDATCETGGVLLGELMNRDDGTSMVSVCGVLEAPDALATSASFTFTCLSWDEIARIKDRDFSSMTVVGWFHTHPGFGVFMSEHDRFIHKHFFDLPWQIACVVDPVREELGFFVWKDGQLSPAEQIVSDNA